MTLGDFRRIKRDSPTMERTLHIHGGMRDSRKEEKTTRGDVMETRTTSKQTGKDLVFLASELLSEACDSLDNEPILRANLKRVIGQLEDLDARMIADAPDPIPLDTKWTDYQFLPALAG